MSCGHSESACRGRPLGVGLRRPLRAVSGHSEAPGWGGRNLSAGFVRMTLTLMSSFAMAVVFKKPIFRNLTYVLT